MLLTVLPLQISPVMNCLAHLVEFRFSEVKYVSTSTILVFEKLVRQHNFRDTLGYRWCEIEMD